MLRYSALVILLACFLGGSVWLVRIRGQAYRESLRQSRRPPIPAPPASPARKALVGDAEAARAVSRPDQSQQVREPDKPALAAQPGAQPKLAQSPAASRDKSAAATTPKAASTPVRQPASEPPPRTEAPPVPLPAEAQAAIARWKNDPFWSRPHLTKQWNLDEFTPQDEQQLGEQLNGLVLQLNPEDRGSGLRRVKETAAPLIEQVSRKDIAYRFFVLNSDVANSFSHPGGYVYVSQKLLDMIPDDEDHMLEFVLGHEIAHVELRHALTCLKDPGVRALSDGTLQKLYFLIIPYGYPDPLEFAADVQVYQRMNRLDRSVHDRLQFLRILDRYAKEHGFEHGRGKPEDLLKADRPDAKNTRVFSPIENHLRAHPAAYERLKRLKELKG
jgi:hypothetical protein